MRTAPRHPWWGLAGWLVATFIAAAAGSAASTQAPHFYAQLVRPSWAPPTSLFGPVWTLLYTLMAVAAWLACRRLCRRAHGAHAVPCAVSFAAALNYGIWQLNPQLLG